MSYRQSILTTILLITSTAVWAQDHLITCPSVSILKSTSFDRIVDDSHTKPHWWYAITKSNFNTSRTWNLLISHFESNNESQANAKATSALQTLTFAQGPLFNPRLHAYVCTYRSDEKCLISTTSSKTD